MKDVKYPETFIEPIYKKWCT